MVNLMYPFVCVNEEMKNEETEYSLTDLKSSPTCLSSLPSQFVYTHTGRGAITVFAVCASQKIRDLAAVGCWISCYLTVASDTD